MSRLRSALRRLLVCGAVLGAAGCASSKYEIQVDALTDPKASIGASYHLKLTGMEGDDDSLRSKEAMAVFQRALAGRGMYEAPPGAKPDVTIQIAYGTDPAVTVKMKETDVPIYAQKGGGMRYETVQQKDASGNIIERTVPVMVRPQIAQVGRERRMAPVAIHEKYIRASARAQVGSGEGVAPVEIWNVSVSIENEGRDLRQYLPAMAATMMDALGGDTGRLKTVEARQDHPDISFVKKGL